MYVVLWGVVRISKIESNSPRKDYLQSNIEKCPPKKSPNLKIIVIL
jgi:hypothetical protein